MQINVFEGARRILRVVQVLWVLAVAGLAIALRNEPRPMGAGLAVVSAVGGWAVLWLLGSVAGWVVRGFVGIPLGRDSLPKGTARMTESRPGADSPEAEGSSEKLRDALSWIPVAVIAGLLVWLYDIDLKGWGYLKFGLILVGLWTAKHWLDGARGLDQWPKPHGRYYDEWLHLPKGAGDYYEWLARRKGNREPWRTWARRERELPDGGNESTHS